MNLTAANTGIVLDSTADYPEGPERFPNWRVVPLYVRFGDETFRDYVEKEFWNHSFVLYRAKSYIEHAASDLYKIDGIGNSAWDDDVQARLRVVVETLDDAMPLAGIAEQGGAFDFLADEPEIYGEADIKRPESFAARR